MKLYLLPRYLLLLLVGLALVISYLSLVRKLPDTTVASNIAQSVTPADLQQTTVPSYPGATILEVDDKQAPQFTRTSLGTDDKPESVAQFYRDGLVRGEWVPLDEIREKFPQSLSFSWSDSSGVSSYDLSLTVSIGGLEISGKPKTIFHLLLQRVPDLQKIPTYKDMSQPDTKDKRDQDGFPERVLTYLSSATPSQVEDFYKSTLPEQGWRLVEHPVSSAKQDLFFTYKSGGVEHLQIDSVSITARETAEHKTLVELEISGTSLLAP